MEEASGTFHPEHKIWRRRKRCSISGEEIGFKEKKGQLDHPLTRTCRWEGDEANRWLSLKRRPIARRSDDGAANPMKLRKKRALQTPANKSGCFGAPFICGDREQKPANPSVCNS